MHKGRIDALSRSVGARKGGSADLSDLTKADLDKLAREKAIKGRSKLSRTDLEAALKASWQLFRQETFVIARLWAPPA
ncbi:hypothetical protein AB5J62_15585 [Amycolatopsis sp. cg5]|uniref:hypothetical protein n=1 Tax=Amycolatopsis sp. cg5 TaxID=3238802 RepID=UPI00352369C2